MTDRFSDRRDAEALQEALERHLDLLGKGVTGAKAGRRIATELEGEAAVLFRLAVGLEQAAAPMPAPSAELTERVAAHIGSIGKVEHLAPRRSLLRGLIRFPGLGVASAAAAIAIFAGLLVPAFRSLPGDALYALKRVSESARVAVVSGSTEAQLRLHIADERYQEVEALVERAQLRGVGPGLAAAAAVDDITDPRLVELIEDTLADAQVQIEAAAEILISASTDVQGLDDLVAISQRGRQLVTQIAEDLPEPVKPPVLSSVVSLARIEAKAKAARMVAEQSQAQPESQPALQPCDTPTPEPTPVPSDPSASAEPTTTATPTGTPEPTTTPEPTPCLAPSPTPTPSESPSPSPTPEQVSETSPPPPSPSQAPPGGRGDSRNAEPSWHGPTPSPGA
ncbi:MAG: DUF5667 domain-containing protein [Actinomycetota bacterium]